MNDIKVLVGKSNDDHRRGGKFIKMAERKTQNRLQRIKDSLEVVIEQQREDEEQLKMDFEGETKP